MSVAPPAGNGAMIVTGRVGKSCAAALTAPNVADSAAASSNFFIGAPLSRQPDQFTLMP